MTIDKLSGAELAAAVAKARGWRFRPPTSTNGRGCWIRSDGLWRLSDDYRPDRDIAQAWELFDKIASLPGYEVLDIRRVRVTGRYSLRRPMGNIMTAFAIGSTLPETICRAYLKAKGDEG